MEYRFPITRDGVISTVAGQHNDVARFVLRPGEIAQMVVLKTRNIDHIVISRIADQTNVGQCIGRSQLPRDRICLITYFE